MKGDRALLITFGIVSFFIFLMFKLPETRIQNLVQAHIKIACQQAGYSFQAEKIATTVFLGPGLKFYNIELKSFENDKQVLKIPYLRVRPGLLSLLPFAKVKKVSFSTDVLEGSASGSIGIGPTQSEVDISFKNLNLGKTTILKKFFPIEMTSAILTGSIVTSFDSDQIQKASGSIQISLNKLALPPQAVYGFNLPKIGVAETKIDLQLGDGKLNIRQAELGKDIKTDDLVAKITGEANLDTQMKYALSPADRFRWNGAKIVFQISSTLIQSLPLLDSLLSSAKTSDGKYSYKLNGPLLMPEAVPSP